MASADVLSDPDGPYDLAREALERAARRVAPTTMARDRALPVIPALGSLLPEGLRRGATVAVGGGPGATTLALALTVAASAAGSWVAMVATPWLGWEAAVELGVVRERLLVACDLPPSSLPAVIAALVDAVDVVVVGRTVGASDARRLTARARERGAVLVVLPRAGRWPQAPDVELWVGASRWEVPARRLVARRSEVVTGGRGAAARRRHDVLWLPGGDGTVATASEVGPG